MKKVFATLTVIAMLAFGSNAVVMAQEEAAPAAQETEQVDETPAPVVEEVVEETIEVAEESGIVALHKTLKTKFVFYKINLTSSKTNLVFNKNKFVLKNDNTTNYHAEPAPTSKLPAPRNIHRPHTDTFIAPTPSPSLPAPRNIHCPQPDMKTFLTPLHKLLSPPHINEAHAPT